MSFISEKAIEKSLNYLRDTSEPAAQARADRIYVEEYLRVVKSQIMQEYKTESLGAQEREAYADPRYLEQLRVIKTAVALDEEYRFRLKAAEAKVEAWRSLCANNRAMGKVV